MLCDDTPSEWGHGEIGIYGDNALTGLCSDATEYAVLSFFGSVFVVVLCLLPQYVLAWALASVSTLHLWFGAIVLKTHNYNVRAMLFNSRQITMPALVFVLVGLHDWFGRQHKIVRLVSVGYSAFVGSVAAQYQLEATNVLYQYADIMGIVLAVTWAFSTRILAQSNLSDGSKA